MIFPYDRLIVAATDEGLSALTEALSKIDYEHSFSENQQVNISLYEITPDDPSIGKKIKDLNIRERTQCIIVGIDRDDSSMPRFSVDTVLKAGDVLWLAGEQDKLDKFTIL